MNAALAFLPGACLAVLPAIQDDITVHGIVRDRGTGEPVGEYALRIQRSEATEPDQGELVWTDTEGRFSSARRYAIGQQLEISKLDHPGLERLSREPASTLVLVERTATFMRVDPDKLPLSLSSTLGPTYRLELTPPPGTKLPALRASLQLQGEFLGPLLRAPVRRGDTPWVRFLPVRNDLPADLPWLLHVESEDGLLAGDRVVAPGAPGESVAIQLVPTARLDVVVKMKRPTEIFFYRGPTVAIERVDSGVFENLLQRELVRFEDNGREYHCSRTGLVAGQVRVLLQEAGVYEPRATVTLVAGEALTCEIEFEVVELPPGVAD